MRIEEPMTMATDYLLAVVGLVFAVILLRIGSLLRSRVTVYWGLAFTVMAIGAAAGGTAHGFASVLSAQQHAFVWKLTVFSIGVASFFMLLASARAGFSPSTASWLSVLAAAKLAVYLYWMAGHDEFIWVIADYGPTMLIVLAVHLYAWRVRRERNARWIVWGVLGSFGGAAIQQSGFALASWFNYNDLYHVAQLGANYLLFRGARSMRDW